MLTHDHLRNATGLGVTALLAVSVPLAIARTVLAEDLLLVAIGAVVATLVALRLWSLPLSNARPVSWWLWVSTVATLIGGALWGVDVLFGYVVAPPTSGLLASLVNPMAVLVSAAFFPLGTAIGLGSAVRAALNEERRRSLPNRASH